MSKKRRTSRPRSSKLRSVTPAPTALRQAEVGLAMELTALNRLLKEERGEEALEKSRALIAEHPEHPSVAKLHGWALLKQEAFAEARPFLEQALAKSPNDAVLLTAVARCLMGENADEKALKLLEQVLAQDARHVDALSLRGSLYRKLKRIPEAIDSFQQVLAIEPGHLATHMNLSHLIRYQPGDSAFEVLEAIDADPSRQPQEQLRCAFTLGKAYLDIGDKAKAFAYYRKANELALTLGADTAQNPPETRLRFIQRHFTPTLYPPLREGGRPEVPQVIVSGLSRSGKSLVESLFSGIEGVKLAGETTTLSDYVKERLEENGGSLGDYLRQLTPEGCREDAQGYLARLGSESGVQVTTIPDDLWLLGLIGLWLPHVPIIFCVRDLLDQGVTCYFHHYQHMEAHGYTYDLQALGRHIACFEKTMDHWTKVLPNPIFLVDYRELTENPEQVAGNLLGALGLERSADYQQQLARNAEQITEISPIMSLDIPMPIRSDFNGIGHDFIEHLDPLIKGYKAVQQEFDEVAAANNNTARSGGNFAGDPLALAQPLVTAPVGDFNWQLPGRIVTLDNGASFALQARFAALMRSGAFAVVCFDPASRLADQQEHLAELEEFQQFPHVVLGDGQPTSLNACLDPALSATLEPLPAAQLPEHRRDGARVLAKLPVSSIALDSIEGLESLDYLVLDACSDSAAILDHGRKALADTLIIQVRVAFQPTHQRQPNLAELMHWAARNGFRFYRLHTPEYYSHFSARDDLTRRQASELESADALLLPSHERMASLNDKQRIKLAFLLDTLYGIHDLSYSLLGAVEPERAEEYLAAQGYLGGEASATESTETESQNPVAVALAKARQALARHSVQRALGIANRLYQALPDELAIARLYAESASLVGHDGKALEILTALHQKHPTDVQGVAALARAQLRAGLWWEAEATLQPHAGDSKTLDIKRLLLDSYLAHEGQPAEAHQAAQARCQALLAIHPDDPELISCEASLLAREQKFEQALAGHAKALAQLGDEQGPKRARLLRAQATTHERAEDVQSACQRLWLACATHPYSRETAQAYKDLKRLMPQCPDGEFAELAPLHKRISEIWAGYKGENLQHSFGDFGLPYQGLERLKLPGTRPADYRLGIYPLAKRLPEGARALDIGCNHGFLLLGLADRLSYGEGFDISQACIDVGNAVAEHLGIEHVHLSSKPFDQFECQEPFDLVIACAVHRWIGMPLEQFGEKLYGFCKPGGLVLLESQGIREIDKTEVGFAQNAQTIASAGFDVIETGGLCDDSVNYREFWLLKRR